MKRYKGAGLLNSVINRLPVELHIPGYQFCGPGTRLWKRLARGDRGINPLDAACRDHDIAYARSDELTDRHVADRVLADRARQRITAADSTLGERAAATAVWAAMKAKTKLGMGMTAAAMRKKGPRRKKVAAAAAAARKRRQLPVAKRRGGVLPLLPLLGVIGSLAGGAAGITKAVNDARAARRQLEELKRHNSAMEGRGIYLAPYKRGKGVQRKKKTSSHKRR